MPRKPKFIHPLRTVRSAVGANGITQAQLAKLIGARPASVQAWEMGRRPMSAVTARRIGEALGVIPDSIRTETGQPLDLLGNPYTRESWKAFQEEGSEPTQALLNKRWAIAMYGTLMLKLDAAFIATLERKKAGAFLVALNEWVDDARSHFGVEKGAEEALRNGLSVEDVGRRHGIQRVKPVVSLPKWPRLFNLPRVARPKRQTSSE